MNTSADIFSIPLKLPNNFPPRWAQGWGEDIHGVFVEVRVEDVIVGFRWIPPGTVQVGSNVSRDWQLQSEEPVHSVTFTEGFWMAQTTVTQALWEKIGSEEQAQSRISKEDRELPIVNVSWDDCGKFCDRFNQKIPFLNVCLPTEAQWEYACRAGTESDFSDGSSFTSPEGQDTALDELGWYDDNSGEKIHPVKQKKSNDWGLYDMHGNVWEWCLDGPRKYTDETEIDPIGPTKEGAGRVLRGGGWFDSARLCRSACRSADHLVSRGGSIGFRLQPAVRQVQ